ncbi:MAG: hypothetical protein SGPRY_014869, partial [Prymnesium sp.]
RLHTDPRFQRLPHKERKVQVDQRFAGMFHEKRFETVAPVDRYGRASATGKAGREGGRATELTRLYELAPDEQDVPEGAEKEVGREEKRGGKKAGKKGGSGVVAKKKGGSEGVAVKNSGREAGSDKGKKTKEKRGEVSEAQVRLAPATVKGPKPKAKRKAVRMGDVEGREKADEQDDWMAQIALAGGAGGGEDTESESEEGSDLDGEEGEENALVSWIESRPGVVAVSESTRRLAVCECDWDSVKAVDLLAVLRSFVPSGGSIRRVAVYPSDFGEERMKEESWRGPAVYAQAGNREEGGENGEEEEEESGAEEEDDVEAMERLRRYEVCLLSHLLT